MDFSGSITVDGITHTYIGHSWPSGVRWYSIGPTTYDIDGADVAWSWFKAHSPGGPA